jgi:hypothetical protein
VGMSAAQWGMHCYENAGECECYRHAWTVLIGSLLQCI